MILVRKQVVRKLDKRHKPLPDQIVCQNSSVSTGNRKFTVWGSFSLHRPQMRNTRDRLVSKAGRSHGTLDSLFPVLKADSGACASFQNEY